MNPIPIFQKFREHNDCNEFYSSISWKQTMDQIFYFSTISFKKDKDDDLRFTKAGNYEIY